MPHSPQWDQRRSLRPRAWSGTSTSAFPARLHHPVQHKARVSVGTTAVLWATQRACRLPEFSNRYELRIVNLKSRQTLGVLRGDRRSLATNSLLVSRRRAVLTLPNYISLPSLRVSPSGPSWGIGGRDTLPGAGGRKEDLAPAPGGRSYSGLGVKLARLAGLRRLRCLFFDLSISGLSICPELLTQFL